MLLLATGLVIWTAAHLLRTVAPDTRESMQRKFGVGAKAIVGVVILLSLVLMVIGYKNAAYVPVWQPPAWMTYVNNVLMVLAVYIYFTTATLPGTAKVFGSIKNPQLTGFKIWAVAHLLVNGDLASVILFGGLFVWAVVQVIVTRESVSLVDRSAAPIKSPWVHWLLVLTVLSVILVAHTWLGKSPFA